LRAKNRFKYLPKALIDLVKAEEAYLLAGHWKMVSEDEGRRCHGVFSSGGTFSVWKNPRYVLTYSRNHAVMIEKSQDENIGIA